MIPHTALRSDSVVITLAPCVRDSNSEARHGPAGPKRWLLLTQEVKLVDAEINMVLFCVCARLLIRLPVLATWKSPDSVGYLRSANPL